MARARIDDELMPLLERIRTAIDLMGGNIAEISRRSDLPATTIAAWIKGQKSEPGALRLARLAKAAGLSVQWLITGEGDMWRPGLEAAGLVNSRTPIEPEKLGKVMAAVAQAFDELMPDADHERRAMAAAVIYEDVADFPGDEFRGGLGVLINRLRRELRGS